MMIKLLQCFLILMAGINVFILVLLIKTIINDAEERKLQRYLGYLWKDLDNKSDKDGKL